jgi:hypothetical protein
VSRFATEGREAIGGVMTLRRWLALCGVVAALLVPVALFFVGGSNSPSDSASATKVLSFYRDHKNANQVAAMMVAIAAVLLVLFAARLREVLRGSDIGAGVLPLAAFGGAVLASAGFSFAAVVHFALVAAADHRFVTAAQTLNVLDSNAFGVVFVGFAIMFLAAGIATVRRPVLPRWLGWAAIVIGVLSMAGPIGFVGFLLGFIWILVVGIMLLVRKDLNAIGAVEVTEVVDITIESFN